MDPLTRDDFRRAMDLWAATYSDASVSPKTTAMQADVVKLQEFKDDLQYLAKRGHMGYHKEPFKFVQIGFKTLLAGLVMGTYVYHGWEVCVATSVIFVAMVRFYTWARDKELQQAVEFCRGVPQG